MQKWRMMNQNPTTVPIQHTMSQPVCRHVPDYRIQGSYFIFMPSQKTRHVPKKYSPQLHCAHAPRTNLDSLFSGLSGPTEAPGGQGPPKSLIFIGSRGLPGPTDEQRAAPVENSGLMCWEGWGRCLPFACLNLMYLHFVFNQIVVKHVEN